MDGIPVDWQHRKLLPVGKDSFCYNGAWGVAQDRVKHALTRPCKGFTELAQICETYSNKIKHVHHPIYTVQARFFLSQSNYGTGHATSVPVNVRAQMIRVMTIDGLV